MREIVIKTFYREKGCYIVKLGNGTLHKFQSEKAAKRFLADTNRYLTEIVFQFNTILSELYQHGREIWLIAPDFSHNQAQDQIKLLEHFIKQSYSRATWKEGNYLTFIDLKKFCEHSKSLIKTYRNAKRVAQMDTIRRHRLDALFAQIQALQIKLLNYGESECFQTFDTSKMEYMQEVSLLTLRVA